MCKLFRSVLIGIVMLLLMNTAAIGLTTNVSGNIDTDTTWNIAGSPYEIIGDINIADSAKLAVESGVIVNNPSDSYVRMVKGTFNAQGAILNDFKIHNGSGNLVMDNVQMNSGRIDSYGKSFNITNSEFNSVIVFHLDSAVDSYLDNNVFNDCGYVDIIMFDVPTRNVYVRYNCFNGEAASAGQRAHLSISHAGTAELILRSNNFNNPNTRVFWLNDTSGDIDASENYWATASPDEAIWDNMDNPNITATVFYNPVLTEQVKNTPCAPPTASMIINNGDSHTSQRDVLISLQLLEEDGTDVSGEIVTDLVWSLAGSPYTLAGDLQINNGVGLTIENGVTVNNPGGYQILVYGTIRAQAALNNPVVFNGVKINVASAGTVIFDYAEFNQGHIRNNLGFQHFTITNCRFNETSYLRINARTDSYFDQNTLINAGYVELIAYTSSHDRDIYARWNSFYGKHPTLALKSCFKVSYEGSDRLVIHYNNFLDENNYGISLHSNTSTVYATNNYWGSTDPAVIATRINDSNDNPSILGTVQFEPLANVPYSIAQTPSEAVYMSFSNDGMTFSAWESYADSKTWTLTDGDGTKEVFAKLKDEAGNISTVSDSIILDTTAPSGTVIGTLDSGIWYWDLVASEWTQMAASTPTGDIAAGDFTGDGKADVASCWGSGLWYQDWATLSWIKVSGSAPNSLTAADVTGDGQAEIIGTWSSGVWYWDVAASIWTKMTVFTPTGDIAAGDFTGDGKADVVSIWDNGLWYQDGATLDWTKVSNTAPTQLTAGDVTGDGRSEIIGSWSSGVWYWDVAVSKWTKMTASTPIGDIAAGDFTGDGKADVASCWGSGLWYQDGATLDWTKVSNTAPTQLTAGDVAGD